MSRIADLQALDGLYEQAIALNREALEQVRREAPPQALQGIFRRKKDLADALGVRTEQCRSAPSDGETTEAEDQALTSARRSQKLAMELEAQLSEALGNSVSRSGKTSAAYLKNGPPQIKNRVDQSG
jgi:hypothetical protein